MAVSLRGLLILHCGSLPGRPCSLSVLPTAQVDVLAAALRASSLDARDEASEATRRATQDEPATGEPPGCGLGHDATGPLISDAVEVTCVHSELGGPGGFHGSQGRGTPSAACSHLPLSVTSSSSPHPVPVT